MLYFCCNLIYLSGNLPSIHTLKIEKDKSKVILSEFGPMRQSPWGAGGGGGEGAIAVDARCEFLVTRPSVTLFLFWRRLPGPRSSYLASMAA